MQLLAGAASTDRGVAAEVGRIDDKRIAFPLANRISQPQMHVAREVRTIRNRDHPSVVPHLHVYRHVRRRLDDLIVVVVAGAEHRDAAGDATFAE